MVTSDDEQLRPLIVSLAKKKSVRESDLLSKNIQNQRSVSGKYDLFI